jgi:hypothetical protein
MLLRGNGGNLGREHRKAFVNAGFGRKLAHANIGQQQFSRHAQVPWARLFSHLVQFQYPII